MQPIADKLAELLKPLPTRFRDYLGTVCESHHADDLERTTKYPLCAACGNDDAELVNVQYAAILLRTTDLLHVTHDRTPSIMYQTVKLSDPKGVEEWDKQLDTFAVRRRGRSRIEKDSETAVIEVHADFTEERPLFALQEYISYANNQIQQSRRWVEKSRQDPDGRDFSFPWRQVKGDVRLEGVPPRPLSFELDRGRLLDLLVGHTIYNDPTVAIRELLQNAIDAVRYQHHLAARDATANGKPAPDMGSVFVRWEPESRVLIVEDNGIGMDEGAIEDHLMRVGASYYNTPQFETEHSDFSPISRFGIGVLTCFMVSDDIEIVTFRDDAGHRIRMTSVHADYLLRELSHGDTLLEGLEPHGTRVTLRLRDSIDLSKKNVADIVRHWVILPECNVHFTLAGTEPQLIGYDSPAEALAEYHGVSSATREPSLEVSQGLEIIVKKTESDSEKTTGSYEIAYAVKESVLPEKTFARQSAKGLPAVCIEGIRVSETLPGYSSSKISALLSVRGDRQFRTTVSRSGLEVDKQYEHVASVCSDLLFEHLADEMVRIGNKAGHPLSQASSASKWLFSDIQAGLTVEDVKQNLKHLYEELASIVVERVVEHEENATKRNLISPMELRHEPFFWTVESRLVDSLSTISRDLGRELSLNEFLAALAPDYKQLRYSPLLPDAHLFKDVITQSHVAVAVEFSRQHQQTVIRWEARAEDSESISIDLDGLLNEEQMNEFEDSICAYIPADYREFGRRYLRDTSSGYEPSLTVENVDVRGDDGKVLAIVTRVGVFVSTDSQLAQILAECRSLLIKLTKEGRCGDELAHVFLAAKALCNELQMSTTELRYGSSKRLGEWRDFVSPIRSLFTEHCIDLEIPDRVETLVGEGAVFDAREYWRDWFTRDEDA